MRPIVPRNDISAWRNDISDWLEPRTTGNFMMRPVAQLRWRRQKWGAPPMRTNQKIARAVAAILGTQAGVVLAADQPAGSDTGGGITPIQEVVVTAQRRSENVQDVPIAIQALS